MNLLMRQLVTCTYNCVKLISTDQSRSQQSSSGPHTIEGGSPPVPPARNPVALPERPLESSKEEPTLLPARNPLKSRQPQTEIKTDPSLKVAQPHETPPPVPERRRIEK